MSSSAEKSRVSPSSDAEEGDDEAEQEKMYSTGAPLRLIDKESFMTYREMIINDTYHHYYATTDWSPDFYRMLACDGFISVSQKEYLIPEIQTYYCILDFPKLHIPKKTRKVARRYISPSKNKLNYRLRMFINRNSSLCVKKIQDYWGSSNWLSDEYVKCLNASGLHVCTFELYLEVDEVSDNGDKSHSHTLVAGEIGYAIGDVYTSLTGFHFGRSSEEASAEPQGSDQESGPVSSTEVTTVTKDLLYCHASSSYIPYPHSPNKISFMMPKDLSRCCGTIQLVSLAMWLKASKFSFWNLGHPPRKVSMKYKRDLGGVIVSRFDFLERWKSAIKRTSPDLIGKQTSTSSLPAGAVEMPLTLAFDI